MRSIDGASGRSRYSIPRRRRDDGAIVPKGTPPSALKWSRATEEEVRVRSSARVSRVAGAPLFAPPAPAVLAARESNDGESLSLVSTGDRA
jgi:hypothetical protein